MEELNEPMGQRKKRKILDIIISIILVILIIILSSFLILRIVYKDYQVSQTSMTPTLSDGDYVLVNKRKKPKRGNVIVINRKGTEPIIKRLIAVGGDKVKIGVDGSVWVSYGGQEDFVKLDESYVVFSNEENEEREWEVPSGKIFVLGDNREVSLDSRSFGFLNYKDIAGVVPQWVIKNKGTKRYKIFFNLFTFGYLKKIFK